MSGQSGHGYGGEHYSRDHRAAAAALSTTVAAVTVAAETPAAKNSLDKTCEDVNWSFFHSCQSVATAINASAANMSQSCAQAPSPSQNSSEQLCGYTVAPIPNPNPHHLPGIFLQFSHKGYFQHNVKEFHDVVKIQLQVTSPDSCAAHVSARAKGLGLGSDGGRLFCDLYNLGKRTGLVFGESVDPLECKAAYPRLCSTCETIDPSGGCLCPSCCRGC
eukprot:SAG11_NODE_2221_length_3669_cov_7.764986_1_plen_218_part_00